MMNERINKIKVKRWMADQKCDEARRYHLYLVGKRNDDSIEFELDDPILKETERAIQVAIKTETEGERWHKAMTFWIPKSQIMQ